MTINMKDKVILISGGTSGIGEGCVREFAKAGAKVFFCGRSTQKGEQIVQELSSQGYDVGFVTADLSITENNRFVVDKCAEKFGRIDGVIANVGGSEGKNNWVHKIDDEDYKKLINLNYMSAFYLTKHSLPYMLKQESGGSFVYMTSATMVRPQPWQSHYGPAKQAMLQLARQVSLEYGRYNINANCVAPGTTYTPILEKNGITPDAASRMNPAHKVVYPKDVAHCCAFLLDENARYVTGTNIFADYAFSCGTPWDALSGQEYMQNVKPFD